MDHVDRPAVGFAGLESGSFLILPPMTSLLAFCENVGGRNFEKKSTGGFIEKIVAVG